METWVIYAIASILTGGLFNFGLKVMQKKKYNISLVTLCSSLTGTLLAGVYCVIKYGINWPIEGGGLILLFSLLNAFFYFLSIQTRVRSLQNIDTTIFFPLHKTFGPILALFTGLFFFNESLSTKEFIGIAIGIMIPLLLITRSENTIQKNLKVGIFFVFITSILAGISGMFPKQAHVELLNVDVFTFFMFFFGTIITGLSYKFIDKNDQKISIDNKIISFGTGLGVLYFLAVLTFNHAMEGNYAVVITINSFSILIPIILSVIFYKEEMTKKKAFVIFLSIVSVILFI